MKQWQEGFQSRLKCSEDMANKEAYKLKKLVMLWSSDCRGVLKDAKDKLSELCDPDEGDYVPEGIPASEEDTYKYFNASAYSGIYAAVLHADRVCPTCVYLALRGRSWKVIERLQILSWPTQ